MSKKIISIAVLVFVLLVTGCIKEEKKMEPIGSDIAKEDLIINQNNEKEEELLIDKDIENNTIDSIDSSNNSDSLIIVKRRIVGALLNKEFVAIDNISEETVTDLLGKKYYIYGSESTEPVESYITKPQYGPLEYENESFYYNTVDLTTLNEKRTPLASMNEQPKEVLDMIKERLLLNGFSKVPAMIENIYLADVVGDEQLEKIAIASNIKNEQSEAKLSDVQDYYNEDTQNTNTSDNENKYVGTGIYQMMFVISDTNTQLLSESYFKLDKIYLEPMTNKIVEELSTIDITVDENVLECYIFEDDSYKILEKSIPQFSTFGYPPVERGGEYPEYSLQPIYSLPEICHILPINNDKWSEIVTSDYTSNQNYRVNIYKGGKENVELVISSELSSVNIQSSEFFIEFNEKYITW